MLTVLCTFCVILAIPYEYEPFKVPMLTEFSMETAKFARPAEWFVPVTNPVFMHEAIINSHMDCEETIPAEYVSVGLPDVVTVPRFVHPVTLKTISLGVRPEHIVAIPLAYKLTL